MLEVACKGILRIGIGHMHMLWQLVIISLTGHHHKTKVCFTSWCCSTVWQKSIYAALYSGWRAFTHWQWYGYRLLDVKFGIPIFKMCKFEAQFGAHSLSGILPFTVSLLVNEWVAVWHATAYAYWMMLCLAATDICFRWQLLQNQYFYFPRAFPSPNLLTWWISAYFSFANHIFIKWWLSIGFLRCVVIKCSIVLEENTASIFIAIPHKEPGTEQTTIFPHWLNTHCLWRGGCVHIAHLSLLSQQWWGHSAGINSNCVIVKIFTHVDVKTCHSKYANE